MAGAAGADTVDEIKYSFGDTNDSVVFDWHGTETTIYYGLDAAYGSSATAQPSAITPLTGDGQPYEEAKVSGLQPGTIYHYKIGTAGLDHTFQTIPTGSFKWVDMGDTMSSACDQYLVDKVTNGSWMPAEQQLAASQNPAFVTHGGDIAVPNQCGPQSIHQYFMDQQVWSLGAAFQPVWGDHEWEPSTAAFNPAPDAINDSNSNYKGRVFITHAQTSVADKTTSTTHPGCGAELGSKVNTCLGEDWGWFQAGGVLYISYPEDSTNSWTDWQAKADNLMAAAQTNPSIDFIVTYGHRPPITDSTIGPKVDAYNSTQALAAKYSPTATNPNGKYVLSVGHHAHSMEAFKPITGLTYIIDAAGGQGLTSWVSPINPNSVFRSMHFGLLSGAYDANAHTLTASMLCGPDYKWQKDSCTYGTTLYTTTFTAPTHVAPSSLLKLSYNDGLTQVQTAQQVTYTASLMNSGNATAAGTTMTATLPNGAQFVSATDGVTPAADGTVSWPTGDLAAGAQVSKQVTVQLGAQNPGDAVTSSAAAIATDISCQNTGSVCTASDSDSVPAPVLATSLSDGVTAPKVNDTLTYTLNTQNTQANSTAGSTAVSLALPVNLTVVSAGGGTVNGNVISWPAAAIPGGQSLSETVLAQVTSGQPNTSFTATANVQSTDCQNSGSNCSASDTDTIPQTVQTVQYIANPSVEVNNTGWTGLNNGQTSEHRVTTDAYDGIACLEVTRITSPAGLAGDLAKPDPVSSVVAGKTYTASVWVKAQAAGQTLNLALKENNAAGTQIGIGSTGITVFDTNWHQLTVSYTAKASGDVLRFNVFNNNQALNSWFHMDLMSLTAPASS